MQQPKYNYFKEKNASLSSKKLFILVGIGAGIAILLLLTFKLMNLFSEAQTQSSLPILSKPVVNHPNTPPGVNDSQLSMDYGSQVRQKLMDGDFDWLEKTASELRASKEKFPGGRWKLASFYSGLSELNTQAPDDIWDLQLGILKKWLGVKPNSITAHVALASFNVNYAWKARGTGYANSVTSEGFQSMEIRLQQAEALLNAAQKLPDKCPEWYVTMQSIALGQGWEMNRYNQLFNEATSLEPLYPYFYESKAAFILPRWYGNEGDWQKFADQTSQKIGGKEGKALYIRIISAMYPYYNQEKFFEEANISWAKVKEGFIAYEELYGTNSYFLNTFCKLAIIARDKETAQQLLQRIGDKWDVTCWNDYQEFQQFKNSIISR